MRRVSKTIADVLDRSQVAVNIRVNQIESKCNVDFSRERTEGSVAVKDSFRHIVRQRAHRAQQKFL